MVVIKERDVGAPTRFTEGSGRTWGFGCRGSTTSPFYFIKHVIVGGPSRGRLAVHSI